MWRGLSSRRVPDFTCISGFFIAWRITDTRLSACTLMMTRSSPTHLAPLWGRQSRNEADISIVVKAIVSVWDYRAVNMTVWIVRTRE